MASAESVKQKLRNLIENANAASGGTFATLSDAVAALIAGYGQGGGDTILDDLTDIHAWKKYKPVSIEQTEYSQVTISYRNALSTSDLSVLTWDTVKYADEIQIVGGAIQLVNPTSFTMTDTSDNDVVLGKYIQTSYNDGFYYIPADTSIAYSKSVYGGSEYVKAYTAFRLNVSPETFLGYVVADESTAYPESGEQDGYLYEYQGLVDTESIDTSDATATAEDIAEGKTAYVNGEKITGVVQTLNDGANNWWSGRTPARYSNGEIGFSQKVSTPMLCNNGATISMSANADAFGDAYASDVAEGKTFTSEAGLKVSGSLPSATSVRVPYGADEIEFLDGYPSTLEVSGALGNSNVLLKENSTVNLSIEMTKFGNATAADVAAGKTFTSANGLLVTGTHECDEGVTLPTLTNPGTAADMASGKELIGQNGEVVTGSLYEATEGATLYGINNPVLSWCDDGKVQTVGAYGADTATGVVVRKGAMLAVRVPATEYGDATASDVAKGKTFTSAAGLLVEGTAEEYIIADEVAY